MLSLRATNRSKAISIPVLVVIASPSLRFQSENGLLVVIASPSLRFQSERRTKQSKLDCFGRPPKSGSLAMTKRKQRYEFLQLKLMILSKKQKQEIQGIGERHNLKLLLLHGSYASGNGRIGSDLDIAVLGKKPIEFKELLDIHGELGKILGDNRERELDLKSLHQANPLFDYQVAQNSQLLYGDLMDYNEFRAYGFRRFYDSKDLFKLEKALIYKFQNYLNKKYVHA